MGGASDMPPAIVHPQGKLEADLAATAEEAERMAGMWSMLTRALVADALKRITALQVEIRLQRDEEARLRREVAACPVAVGNRTVRREPEPATTPRR